MNSLTLSMLGLLLVLVTGCMSPMRASQAEQEALQAYRRTSERRTAVELTEAQAEAYARLITPFSHVALHVYCRYLRSPAKADAEECNRQSPLEYKGWVRLFDSHEFLSDAEQRTGLAFSAFARADNGRKSGEIVISFRGTDFTSIGDWYSNLRWVTRILPWDDQYNVLYRHSQHLVDLALQKAGEKVVPVGTYKLYTTGHSLGGGLAQMLAYADSRIQAAVVFDSSPVTGYSTIVDDSLVNCDARVLRVYERHEALQYVRSFLRLFYTLSTNIYELGFNLVHSGGNPVANHSMRAFHDKLVAHAGLPGAIEELPGTPDCACFQKRRPSEQSQWPAMCQLQGGAR